MWSSLLRDPVLEGVPGLLGVPPETPVGEEHLDEEETRSCDCSRVSVVSDSETGLKLTSTLSMMTHPVLVGKATASVSRFLALPESTGNKR